MARASSLAPSSLDASTLAPRAASSQAHWALPAATVAQRAGADGERPQLRCLPAALEVDRRNTRALRGHVCQEMRVSWPQKSSARSLASARSKASRQRRWTAPQRSSSHRDSTLRSPARTSTISTHSTSIAALRRQLGQCGLLRGENDRGSCARTRKKNKYAQPPDNSNHPSDRSAPPTAHLWKGNRGCACPAAAVHPARVGTTSQRRGRLSAAAPPSPHGPQPAADSRPQHTPPPAAARAVVPPREACTMVASRGAETHGATRDGGSVRASHTRVPPPSLGCAGSLSFKDSRRTRSPIGTRPPPPVRPRRAASPASAQPRDCRGARVHARCSARAIAPASCHVLPSARARPACRCPV